MLLLGFVLLLLLSVPLFRGRLSALADVRFRKLWVLALAAGLQAASAVLDGLPVLRPALHTASYVVAGGFFWANRRVPGLWLIGLGGAMNLAAIVANSGVMPADPGALAAAGLNPDPGYFSNSAVVPDPNLRFLGDIFAVPEPVPLSNVFSAGDLSIALGIVVALHRLCRSRLIPAGEGQFRELWRQRDFMHLWAANGISNLGDWVYALAVVTAIADLGFGSHALALLLILQVGPSAAAGILGGPLVDRLPRRGLMISADLLRAAAVGSLLLVETPGLAHLYGVAASLGLFGALFQPSLQASLPNVVPKERLVAANSLVSASFHVAVMLGPVIGGLLVARLGATPAFAINALSFVASALLLGGVRLPPPETRRSGVGGERALVEGIRYALRTPLVRGVFVVTGVLMFAAALRSPLEPLFILRTLDQGPESLGLLGGVWGFGMILGAVAAPAAARRWMRERLFGVSVAAVGVAVLIVSRATALAPVLGLWLLAGLGNGIGSISYESLLQERTPDRFRGRVMAASEAVLDAAFLLGAAASGWFASGLGLRGAFAVSGALMLVGAAACWPLLIRGRASVSSERGGVADAYGFAPPRGDAATASADRA